MSRYYVGLVTVVVINAIGLTIGPIYAQPPVPSDSNDGHLRFSGWKMYYIEPPSRVGERDVDILLTDDGRLLILHEKGSVLSPTFHTINISDIYQWGSVNAQERMFDRRQLVRVFYRDNGVNRYTIIGRPDNDREDDLAWLILTSELQTRTGLMSTADTLLQLLQR